MDSVIVKSIWASIGSTAVVVPVYAHLCSSDTIPGFVVFLEWDTCTSFLALRNIVYKVHDSSAPSFYEVIPDPFIWMPVAYPDGHIEITAVFGLEPESWIVNPSEGRYCMFHLVVDVVAQDTGTTIVDVTGATLGNNIPVLVDGIFTVTLSGVSEPFRPSTLPKLFALSQNYPNPFNSATLIRYTLPDRDREARPHRTTLKVHNVLGQLVRTLVDEEQVPGYYSVVWDGRDSRGKEVKNGVYLCCLKVGGYAKTRKLVLLR